LSAWNNWRVSLLACAGFTAALGVWFWFAWHPSPTFYAYNLPLAPAFAAFLLERLAVRRWRSLPVDGVVVALALARVFAPPFPFVSGHVLFAGYAALAARTWVLRATALIALASSLAIKLSRWGDWKTPLGAMVVAIVAAAVARRLSRSPCERS
jgi:hypothetical protein